MASMCLGGRSAWGGSQRCVWASRCPTHIVLPPHQGSQVSNRSCALLPPPTPTCEALHWKWLPHWPHSPAEGRTHHPSHYSGRLLPLSTGHRGASGPGPRSWCLGRPGSPQAVAPGCAVSVVGVWPRPCISLDTSFVFALGHAPDPGSVSDWLWGPRE